MGGIRNLKSGLRPETIGADKDFKDLRAFKGFSDGGDRREWLRCSMGGVYGDVGAMGAKGMMGAPRDVEVPVMDERRAMWKRWELWHGRARYENLDTLRALSADIFE